MYFLSHFVITNAITLVLTFVRQLVVFILNQLNFICFLLSHKYDVKLNVGHYKLWKSFKLLGKLPTGEFLSSTVILLKTHTRKCTLILKK